MEGFFYYYSILLTTGILRMIKCPKANVTINADRKSIINLSSGYIFNG